MIETLWRTVWQYLVDLNVYIPSGITIELLRIFPREVLVHVFETCIRLFLVAALFIIKNWKP